MSDNGYSHSSTQASPLWLRVAETLCRLVLTVTFIFSGFVKAVDPLGTQYKIEDYLAAMGLGGLLPDVVTLTMSVALAALEFCMGIFLLFAILTRGGIGGGDIKLIGALGLWLGTEKLLLVIFLGCLLGGLFALLALLTGRKKRGEAIPYAPGFTLAALFISLC